MATTAIQIRASERSTPGTSATRAIRWLRIAAGSVVATVLLTGLMALAGQAVPMHPTSADPVPGAPITLVDQ